MTRPLDPALDGPPALSVPGADRGFPITAPDNPASRRSAQRPLQAAEATLKRLRATLEARRDLQQ